MVQRHTENLERKTSLQRKVLDMMHEHECKSVKDVINRLQQLDKSLTAEEILDAMNALKHDNKIAVSESKVEGSFWKYLASLSSAYFWLTVVVSLATLVAVYVAPDVAPWSIVRIVAGASFMLFIPGYALIHLLFAAKAMDAIEQIALSIGLSLAVTPLIGLILNYSYWGISLDPMIISLSILSVALAFSGNYRRFSYRREIQASKTNLTKILG